LDALGSGLDLLMRRPWPNLLLVLVAFWIPRPGSVSHHLSSSPLVSQRLSRTSKLSIRFLTSPYILEGAGLTAFDGKTIAYFGGHSSYSDKHTSLVLSTLKPWRSQAVAQGAGPEIALSPGVACVGEHSGGRWPTAELADSGA
jgi:hypothetical protein